MGTLTRVATCGDDSYTLPRPWHPCVSTHRIVTPRGCTSRAHALVDWWAHGGGGARLRADATVVVLAAHSLVMIPPHKWAVPGTAAARSSRRWSPSPSPSLRLPRTVSVSLTVSPIVFRSPSLSATAVLARMRRRRRGVRPPPPPPRAL